MIKQEFSNRNTRDWFADMNTILSLATGGIGEHAEVFLQTQRRYADRWGYKHWLMTDKIWTEFKADSYSKVPAISRALDTMEDGEILIFLDADIGITNYTVDLGNLIRSRPDFYLIGYEHAHWRSWRHLCNAALIMRKCAALESFMSDWIDICLHGSPHIIPGQRTKIVDVPHEQMLFDELIRHRAYAGIYPANAWEIGTFSWEIWNDTTRWLKGMPTVHCGGAQATWERRAQVFRDIYMPQIIY